MDQDILKTRLKDCFTKIKKLGEEYKRKISDCTAENNAEILQLKRKFNKDLKDLEQDYAAKKYDLKIKYELDLAQKEKERVEKLFALEVEYSNKRCDAECDISYVNHLLEKYENGFPGTEVLNDAKGNSTKNLTSELATVNCEGKSSTRGAGIISVTASEQNNSINNNGVNVPHEPPKNKELELIPQTIQTAKKKSPYDNFTNADIVSFMNFVNSSAWISQCGNLKLNPEATSELNKVTFENWNQDAISSKMHLVVGKNQHGGGYVCSKTDKGGMYLVVPSPVAILSDKIVVSNGYLYYFSIYGSYGPNAKAKVIKPAIVEEKDECFTLVEKGKIELI